MSKDTEPGGSDLVRNGSHSLADHGKTSRNPDDSRLRGGVAVRLDCDNVDAPARNPSELLARPGQSHEWVAKIRVYINQSVDVAGRGGPGKHWRE